MFRATGSSPTQVLLSSSCLSFGRRRFQNAESLYAPHANHDFFWMTLTHTDEHEPRQSLDIGSRHFERGRGAKINQRGIDVFASEELLHHLRRRMSDSAILDVNELPLVRF